MTSLLNTLGTHLSKLKSQSWLWIECEGPQAVTVWLLIQVDRQDQVCPEHVIPITTLTDPQSSFPVSSLHVRLPPG